MNSKDILYALQKGKMSPEYAEKELMEMMGAIPQRPLAAEPKGFVVDSARGKMLAIKSAWPQFPELIHLNHIYEGRPVFWFHGGIGTVSGYRVIARNSKRPFYGIEPRGWNSKRDPLHGMQAMAAYYVHIILSVQTEGPYDIGGYSLGGRLAYEVARQLQELGQTVNTIVMIDSIPANSPYHAETEETIQKTLLLQAVNMSLLSTIEQKSQLSQILIHPRELDINASDDEFLQQLLTLARTRGLRDAEERLNVRFERRVKIQRAYGEEHFLLLPLPKPQQLRCYYFRNKSGVFYGELEPFLRVGTHQTGFDHTSYWEEWRKMIPDFCLMDVDSSNHMVLLSEPKVHRVISEFCQNLYV